MAELRLTPAAVQDLEGIWHYTAQRWSVSQAERYIDRLTACFEALAQAPLSAPACDHIRPGYRRQVVESHVVYFRTGQDMVTVVRILHERMDAPRHV
jgi:toxin ParE1/3/4